VQESKEKEALDTPGGADLMKRLGGPAGLPFFAFLDSNGGMIVNSMRPRENGTKGENIGHPYEPEEVDWFMTMVRRAAPGITGNETAALEHWLRNQKQRDK
jgi:hypothetical protein